jgi:uncharacterized repeat protein (TIGR01451 family)
MKPKRSHAALIAGWILLAGAGYAAGTSADTNAAGTVRNEGPVVITTRSLQLKTVTTKEGKKVKKWLKATEVVPGDVVRYLNRVRNRSDNTLEKVRVVNPINPHLSYVGGSAKCEEGCTILYSLDRGKHFDTPEHLFVIDAKGKKHPAKPGDYTAIEWTIDRIGPRKSVTVEFKAKLK